MVPSLDQIAHIFQDIKILLNSFNRWSIRHIYIEINQAVDWITNVDYLVASVFYIDTSTTSALHTISVNDDIVASLVAGGLNLYLLYLYLKNVVSLKNYKENDINSP